MDNYGMAQMQANAYPAETQAPSQLMALAEDVARAENRIHGAAQDSISSRVRSLHMALDALEGSLASVMR